MSTTTKAVNPVNVPLAPARLTPDEIPADSLVTQQGPDLTETEKSALAASAEKYVNDFFAVQPDDPTIELLIGQIMEVGNSVMQATVVDSKLLQNTDAKENAALLSIKDYANTITELDAIYRKIDVRNKWWASFLPERTIINRIIARHRSREDQINSISAKLEKLIGQLSANNMLLHETRLRTWELFGALKQEIYKIDQVRKAIEATVGPNGTLRSEKPELADRYYNKINPALSRKEADLEIHFKVLEANYLGTGEEQRANEYRKLDGAALLTTNRLALETSSALKSARQDGELYDKAAAASKATADKLITEMAIDGRKSAEAAANNLRNTAVSASNLLQCIDTMRETAKLTSERANDSARILQETRDTLRAATAEINA